MTDEQINVAIHAALGNPIGCPRCSEPECAYNSVRNYCIDLNAMRNVEKCVEDRNKYLSILANLTKAEEPSSIDNDWFFCRATAHQRAEAFLRTLGKWEDRN